MTDHKGNARSKGIQLTFDETGEPQIAQPDKIKIECFGGVMCHFCEISDEDIGGVMRCQSPKGNGAMVAGFKRCPEGKWEPIVGLGEAPVLKAAMFTCDWDICCNCGTATMWTLKEKNIPKKSKPIEPHWICAACHPPSPAFNKKDIMYRKRNTILKEKGKLP